MYKLDYVKINYYIKYLNHTFTCVIKFKYRQRSPHSYFVSL